eukprot:1426744-Pleurochrysis_carterae.AAC.5
MTLTLCIPQHSKNNSQNSNNVGMQIRWWRGLILSMRGTPPSRSQNHQLVVSASSTLNIESVVALKLHLLKRLCRRGAQLLCACTWRFAQVLEHHLGAVDWEAREVAELRRSRQSVEHRPRFTVLQKALQPL